MNSNQIVFDGALGTWTETARGEYIFLPTVAAPIAADVEMGDVEDDAATAA